MITILSVRGTPGPQGSKRAFARKGKDGKTKVSMVESSNKVKPWRAAVVQVWEAGRNGKPHSKHTGPVTVEITFYLPRPVSQYRTGKYSHLLKASAPEYPAVKPDVDKLARATLDALTDAGAIEDDSRVVDLVLRKRYTGPDVHPLGIPGPGAEILIHSGD